MLVLSNDIFLYKIFTVPVICHSDMFSAKEAEFEKIRKTNSELVNIKPVFFETCDNMDDISWDGKTLSIPKIIVDIEPVALTHGSPKTEIIEIPENILNAQAMAESIQRVVNKWIKQYKQERIDRGFSFNLAALGSMNGISFDFDFEPDIEPLVLNIIENGETEQSNLESFVKPGYLPRFESKPWAIPPGTPGPIGFISSIE